MEELKIIIENVHAMSEALNIKTNNESLFYYC